MGLVRCRTERSLARQDRTRGRSYTVNSALGPLCLGNLEHRWNLAQYREFAAQLNVVPVDIHAYPQSWSNYGVPTLSDN
jgi:hypothetical protein